MKVCRLWSLVFGCTIGVTMSGEVRGFPYGYKRLQKEQCTVTVFYESHEPAKNTTVDEMKALPYKEAKRKLHRSEQRLLNAFARINASTRADIIWEFRPEGRPSSPYFMGLAPTWILERFRNIRFIYADCNRVSFRSTIVIDEQNISGSTFHNPMPLSHSLKKEILSRSGAVVWAAYKRLYQRVKQELHSDYRDYYNSSYNLYTSEQFEPTLSYDQIADLEVLSYVLSSDKDTIIVYTGGAHSERIVDFLVTEAEFDLIGEHGCKEVVEIGPRSLDFLDAAFKKKNSRAAKGTKRASRVAKSGQSRTNS